MHLVGFIRIYHDARSPERQILHVINIYYELKVNVISNAK